MKKYQTPEIEISCFAAEDVITTSAVLAMPKTTIQLNGVDVVEARDLGEQDFSIFSE